MAILKIKDPTTGEWQEVTVMQGKTGPQGPAGPNEISTDTASSITGILKGNGSTVAVAEAGVDYATSEQAKTFVVTFTDDGSGITADKGIEEIYTQYNLNRNIIGLYRNALLLLVSCQSGLAEFQGLYSSKMTMIVYSSDLGIDFAERELMLKPSQLTALPASGTALTANTIYAVADAVGTYAFTPPSSGWAHGKFTTGASASVSFAGTFLGAAPSIEASKTYEFDVLDGVWAVQEVVSA